MALGKSQEELTHKYQFPVFSVCQPETFLAAGGPGVNRMDMMAQFKPRPGM